LEARLWSFRTNTGAHKRLAKALVLVGQEDRFKARLEAGLGPLEGWDLAKNQELAKRQPVAPAEQDQPPAPLPRPRPVPLPPELADPLALFALTATGEGCPLNELHPLRPGLRDPVLLSVWATGDFRPDAGYLGDDDAFEDSDLDVDPAVPFPLFSPDAVHFETFIAAL
jgi:hypothetical protein